MASISGIQAFILRDAYSPTNDQSEVDFSQFEGETANAVNDLFEYDFIDGNGDTKLQDSDDGDGTRYTGGDRIRYDGEATSARSLASGSVRITYDNGDFYDAAGTGVRFIALNNGDLIISPLDSMRNDESLLPISRWETVTITSTNPGLSRISMGDQDDPFPTCFVRGTLIATAKGAIAVEDLREGDLVLTQDHGLQPIRWINTQKIDSGTLKCWLSLRPIRIRAGVIGVQTPHTDLLVSQQHRILVRSKIARRMFGASEVLVAVKQLLEVDGIDIVEDITEVEYYHFLFERHELVLSNGCVTESLYPGPQALRSIGSAALEELFTLFPELWELSGDDAPVPARPLTSGRKARKLARRHAEHQRRLWV